MLILSVILDVPGIKNDQLLILLNSSGYCLAAKSLIFLEGSNPFGNSLDEFQQL